MKIIHETNEKKIMKGRNHLEDLGTDGRILNWILNK
jgi:hypothetical protein